MANLTLLLPSKIDNERLVQVEVLQVDTRLRDRRVVDFGNSLKLQNDASINDYVRPQRPDDVPFVFDRDVSFGLVRHAALPQFHLQGVVVVPLRLARTERRVYALRERGNVDTTHHRRTTYSVTKIKTKIATYLSNARMLARTLGSNVSNFFLYGGGLNGRYTHRPNGKMVGFILNEHRRP